MTGLPESLCSKCGVNPRAGAYHWCQPCKNEQARERYAEGVQVTKHCACGVAIICNKEKSPQCGDCRRAYSKRRYRDNVNGTRDKTLAARTPQQAREWKLRRDYGITSADYARMLLAQDGKCAICEVVLTEPLRQKGQPTTVATIDHDHETGEVRGVLCNRCNVGIGNLGDSVEGVERALSYLREAQQRGKKG
jgi:hypothetical protein